MSIGDPYYVPAFSGMKRHLVQKQDKFQYVSLLDTLQNILKTDILDYVLQPHNGGDEFLEDFCYGQRFISHAIFSSNPRALQIIAYFDELEVCNPLGTHTKMHKLGIFLFTLVNIPPMKRQYLSFCLYPKRLLFHFITTKSTSAMLKCQLPLVNPTTKIQHIASTTFILTITNAMVKNNGKDM